MFNKKKCSRCGEKFSDKYRFCSNCGFPVNNSRDEDWGMLGKDDIISDFEKINLPIGFNSLFNSLMKSFNKEFEQINKETTKKINKEVPEKQLNNMGISISISTFGNKSPQIKVRSFGPGIKQPPKQFKKQILPNLSKEDLKKFSTLPKEEPVTNIRRLSNRVIYEIDIPGVKSIKDVSIVRLENSIEIKALSKDKVYSKIIPINLPITNYNFSDEKLVLELGAED